MWTGEKWRTLDNIFLYEQFEGWVQYGWLFLYNSENLWQTNWGFILSGNFASLKVPLCENIIKTVLKNKSL